MLRFSNPSLLWFLFAMLIPIIVHLFNFRKYKIFYFSNTRFLQDLQKKTNKQSQLRKIMIMLLRMMAIGSLVFVFARPYWSSSETAAVGDGNTSVAIYIDNSFSMGNLAQRGNLLEEAKLCATAIAEAHNQDDKFMLITNDFEGKHQQFLTKDEFKNEVEYIETSSLTRSLSEVTAYAQRSLGQQNTARKSLFLVSDFQVSTSDFVNLNPDTVIGTTIVPLTANQISNLYIDTLWVDAPGFKFGQQVNIHVFVRNMSEADVEKLPVRLYINKVQKSLATTDVPKKGVSEVVLNYTIDNHRIQEGYVEITDHPITFDDRLYFSLLATDRNHILFLFNKSDNDYLRALFANDSTLIYEHINLKNVRYNELSQQSLIIIENADNLANGLVQELTQYVQKGGNLLILPPSTGGIFDNSLNRSLGVSELGKKVEKQLKVSDLNLKHALFARVFEQYPDNIELPTVRQYFESSTILSANKETLIRLENDVPLLFSQRSGEGMVFVMTVYPDDKFTDFQKHAIFVPTIYNMSLSWRTREQSYCVIGKNMNMTLDNIQFGKDEIIEIKNKDAAFIPTVINNAQGVQMRLNHKVEKSGNYGVWYADSLLMGMSFNYNRLESDMNFLSIDKIRDLTQQHGLKNIRITDFQDKSSAVVSMQLNRFGTPLYMLFVVLTLVFLLAEIAMIRWRKLN